MMMWFSSTVLRIMRCSDLEGRGGGLSRSQTRVRILAQRQPTVYKDITAHAVMSDGDSTKENYFANGRGVHYTRQLCSDSWGMQTLRCPPPPTFEGVGGGGPWPPCSDVTEPGAFFIDLYALFSVVPSSNLITYLYDPITFG